MPLPPMTFWAGAVLINLVNAALSWRCARKDMAARPERAADYKLLLHVFFFALNVPLAIMGLGMVVGGVPDVFHFMRPRDGNPWVVALHVTLLLLLLAWLAWLLRGGPEWLIKRWAAPTTTPTVPRRLKLFMGLPLVMAILGMLAMWLVDVPV